MAEQQGQSEFVVASVKVPFELDMEQANTQLEAFEKRVEALKESLSKIEISNKELAARPSPREAAVIGEEKNEKTGAVTRVKEMTPEVEKSVERFTTVETMQRLLAVMEEVRDILREPNE